MDDDMTTQRGNIWSVLASYVILVAAGVVGLRFNPPANVALRWSIVILLAAIAVLQSRRPEAGSPPWRTHAYLGVYGVLVAVLMFTKCKKIATNGKLGFLSRGERPGIIFTPATKRLGR